MTDLRFAGAVLQTAAVLDSWPATVPITFLGAISPASASY